MRLTKYAHACFVLEKDNKTLIVDPGVWSTDFVVPGNVVAVVVTHEHPDHFDIEKLAAIIEKNPDAVIIAHEDITKQISDISTQSVSAEETFVVESFSLEFFGGQHAVIHPNYPRIANLGVMIDNTVYYPGDSFAKPNKPVKVLALPVTAPWLKISEAMDFCAEVKADFVFPTHDAVASEFGKALPDRMLPSFAESYGGKYQRLTESIEI
ncbi:MAG TPA: MBL fold metallo-hydrolase [Candidatus Saccharimonadales bacterium]